MSICKHMIKKTIKEAKNVKSPERIKRSLKLLLDNVVYLKLSFNYLIMLSLRNHFWVGY